MSRWNYRYLNPRRRRDKAPRFGILIPHRQLARCRPIYRKIYRNWHRSDPSKRVNRKWHHSDPSKNPKYDSSVRSPCRDRHFQAHLKVSYCEWHCSDPFMSFNFESHLSEPRSPWSYCHLQTHLLKKFGLAPIRPIQEPYFEGQLIDFSRRHYCNWYCSDPSWLAPCRPIQRISFSQAYL